MKNKKIIRKITQGVYVLTTTGGGCIVDAVSQISAGETPLISVAVMKSNYTNELLRKNKQFALSVLGKNVNPEIIDTFGMHSMRDMNKFEKTEILDEEVPVIKNSLGYMICEIVECIENETHTLWIGRLKEADVFHEEEALSYQYYQEHKESYVKVKTENGKTLWICTVCGYIYEGEILPEEWKCPICGVDPTYFQKKQ